MKPYFDENGIVIYHADCREVLPTLAPVDIVLTDPPYSVSTAANYQYRSTVSKGKRHLNFFEGDMDWDEMTRSVAENVMLAAALAPAVYVWCGHRQFGRIVEGLESCDFQTRFLVWRKTCPIPAPPGVGWDSAAELCVYGFKKSRKWLPPTGTKCPNVIEADNYRHGQPGKVAHPTQKPFATAIIPLKYSSSPGDTVLDPYLGSGTTLVAAKRLGLKAIGIEIEERYCEIAAERLRQHVLFAAG